MSDTSDKSVKRAVLLAATGVAVYVCARYLEKQPGLRPLIEETNPQGTDNSQGGRSTQIPFSPRR